MGAIQSVYDARHYGCTVAERYQYHEGQQTTHEKMSTLHSTICPRCRFVSIVDNRPPQRLDISTSIPVRANLLSLSHWETSHCGQTTLRLVVVGVAHITSMDKSHRVKMVSTKQKQPLHTFNKQHMSLASANKKKSSTMSHNSQRLVCVTLTLVVCLLFLHNQTHVVRQASSGDREQRKLKVELDDSVYQRGAWDGSPVVLEDFKLVFFTSAKVGCTAWKQLFRRMMGYDDWEAETWPLPWDPDANGLIYLYDYSEADAASIMTDPSWTKAIFVRDPKVRFISAYLDKGVRHETFLNEKCCPETYDCLAKSRESPRAFLEIAQKCPNPHWSPQTMRMEEKYWPYINFVGHMENMSHDAEALLRRVGAWEQFGASGWGTNKTERIFEGPSGRQHATNATEKLKQYLTPSDEQILDRWYAPDYNHSVMGLEPTRVFR